MFLSSRSRRCERADAPTRKPLARWSQLWLIRMSMVRSRSGQRPRFTLQQHSMLNWHMWPTLFAFPISSVETTLMHQKRLCLSVIPQLRLIIDFKRVAQDEFKKIPGSPVAYWVSDQSVRPSSTRTPPSRWLQTFSRKGSTGLHSKRQHIVYVRGFGMRPFQRNKLGFDQISHGQVMPRNAFGSVEHVVFLPGQTTVGLPEVVTWKPSSDVT